MSLVSASEERDRDRLPEPLLDAFALLDKDDYPFTHREFVGSLNVVDNCVRQLYEDTDELTELGKHLVGMREAGLAVRHDLRRDGAVAKIVREHAEEFYRHYLALRRLVDPDGFTQYVDWCLVTLRPEVGDDGKVRENSLLRPDDVHILLRPVLFYLEEVKGLDRADAGAALEGLVSRDHGLTAVQGELYLDALNELDGACGIGM